EVLYKGSAAAWQLTRFSVMSGTNTTPTASVCLTQNGEMKCAAAMGDGPVDAAFKAIDQVTESDLHLVDFSLEAVTEGEDALGRVTVKIQRDGGRSVKGRAVSTDIVLAAVKAYINALNSLYVQESAARQRSSDACQLERV